MDPRGEELEALLLEQLGWLRGRCVRAARGLPGTDPDDLLQGALAEFVERAPAWFAHSETRDLVARVRHLLVLCLRHRVTDEERRRRRTGQLDVDGSDDEDPFDVLPDRSPLADEHAAALRTVAVLDGLDPARRLLVKAMALPDLVTADDLRDARAVGGSGRMLTRRDPDEAWRLFQELRAGGAPAREGWVRDLAWLLYLDGPREAADEDELTRTVGALTRTERRAREQLAARLAACTDDPGTRLARLCVLDPAQVVADDFGAAPDPERALLVRGAGPAYREFERLRPLRSALSPVEWTRRIGWLLFLDGPWSAADPADVARAAARVLRLCGWGAR